MTRIGGMVRTVTVASALLYPAIVASPIVGTFLHQTGPASVSAKNSTPVKIAVPTPDAAQKVATAAACAPFVHAGREPEGQCSWGESPKLEIDAVESYTIRLFTDVGVITADLYPQGAPIAANSFVFLACQGYYNHTFFHRVIPNFVIQGGDRSGTGSGGPGYSFKDETVPRKYEIGDLVMANAGPDTNGSQFFIVEGAEGVALPRSYTLFGHVTAGQNLVTAIATAPTHQTSDGGEDSAPNTPVHIRTITVQAKKYNTVLHLFPGSGL